MREMPLIHWMNTIGAECGAPRGAYVSPYPHIVTCPVCITALKIDVLERRAAARRLSIARAGIRSHDGA